eukprot:14285195-Ditylum_brightwellii.AAC.1
MVSCQSIYARPSVSCQVMWHQDLWGSEMNTSPPSSSQTNGMSQSLQSLQWTMCVNWPMQYTQ